MSVLNPHPELILFDVSSNILAFFLVFYNLRTEKAPHILQSVPRTDAAAAAGVCSLSDARILRNTSQWQTIRAAQADRAVRLYPSALQRLSADVKIRKKCEVVLKKSQYLRLHPSLPLKWIWSRCVIWMHKLKWPFRNRFLRKGKRWRPSRVLCYGFRNTQTPEAQRMWRWGADGTRLPDSLSRQHFSENTDRTRDHWLM